MGYKVISENTANLLSLHDCDCSHLYYDGNKIIMEMDWMEVLGCHPNNPYKKAHQSTAGRIELYNPKINDAVLCRVVCQNLLSKKEQKENTDIDEFELKDMDFKDIEITQFEEKPLGIKYQTRVWGYFNPIERRKRNKDEIAFMVTYDKSIVKWNELRRESWFESMKWRQKK